MANTAPVFIWVAGPDKRRTFFNKSWLDFTGRTMEQELAFGWTDGVHPDDLDRYLAIYSSSAHIQRSYRIAYRLRRSDGEYRWVLDDGVPRIDPKGTSLAMSAPASILPTYERRRKRLSYERGSRACACWPAASPMTSRT